ncbi:MAG TPA: ATP-binding protein, partial [Candidatus Nanopelagicales bacterium]|nr:ATP-binding protein [Candidatus Nanopelagicales bacterium]
MSERAPDLEPDLARVERELEAARAALRALVEGHGDGVVIVDHEGVVRFANPAAEALFGQGLPGRPFGFPLVAGELCEIDVVRRGGPPALAEMRVAETTWEGRPALLCALRDITARRRAEEALRRKEERLRQAQRVEAVGLLAAEMAHHMNNVLMGVTGCARAALMHVDEGHPAHRFLHEIQRSTQQGATLMRQVGAFSRQRAHHPEVIDLNEVVGSFSVLLRRIVGDDITVETSLDPTVWPVTADVAQIEQALMTLVVNARDAMPEGGRITIETRKVVVSQAPAQPRRGPMPGEHVVLVVRDTGAGMDRATQARLFEPLFTTKDDGTGTGLGLPTVQAIVEESSGHVAIESAVGHGTSVIIHLPRARPVASYKPAPPLPPPAPGTETVLLVDDEESIRLALRHALESSGYRILDAQDGERALALSEQYPGPIHALIT